MTYDEKKTAGERLLLACSELPNSEEKVIGSYRGFELSLRFDTYHSEYQALLKGQRKYPVALGKDPLGCIIRLDNSLNNFPERISSVENELATLKQQQAAAQIEVEKPFPQEEELAEKSARLAELNAQLDMDEKSHEPEQDEEPRRSSVLAALEEKSDKVEPIKPFKSYLDKDVMLDEWPPRPAVAFPCQQAGTGTDLEQDGIQRYFEHWLLSAKNGSGRLLPAFGFARVAAHGLSPANVQQQSQPVYQSCQRKRSGLCRRSGGLAHPAG